MGGIFGLACRKTASGEILRTSLERLTYRGNDGVGVVALLDKKFIIKKAPGTFDHASSQINLKNIQGRIILGHTRFATHGRPSIENTHPLTDCSGKLAVVGDGVIANYEELKEELEKRGHKFVSRSDFEVVAHLIEENLKNKSFLEAFLSTLKTLEGVYALAVVHENDEKIYAASIGQSLVVGLGKECLFLSSDIPSLYGFADRAVVLEFNQAVMLSHSGYKVFDIDSGAQVEPFLVKSVKYAPEVTDKAGFPHFMLKEIYEIPEALLRAVDVLQDKYLNLSAMILHSAKEVYIIANGTSLHAGLIAGYYFSDLARINTHIVSAAEFPYYGLRNVSIGTAVLAISQSGETGDVLRVVREVKIRGGVVIGITNTMGSRLTIESNVYLPIGAGPEIAVPATKTFTSTLVVLGMLACRAGVLRGVIDLSEEKLFIGEVKKIAKALKNSIERIDRKIEEKVKIFEGWNRCYLTSRGINFPVALEGALKFKEAAGLQGEGIETGELRHGPITLIESGYPVVMVAPYERDAKESSMKIAELIKEYGGEVILVSPEKHDMTHVITVPDTMRYLSPIASIVPLQLLAYRLGVARKQPIDKPRALVKAITA